jgi:hypothetical protein
MLKGLEKCLKFSFIVRCKYLFGYLRLICTYFCLRWNNVNNLKPKILKQQSCANSIFVAIQDDTGRAYSIINKMRCSVVLIGTPCT